MKTLLPLLFATRWPTRREIALTEETESKTRGNKERRKKTKQRNKAARNNRRKKK